MKHTIWLMETVGLSAHKCGALIRRFGSAKAACEASLREVQQVCLLSLRQRRAFEKKSFAEADRILGQCRAQNIEIITLEDPRYPPRLKTIYDPPAALYLRGQLPEFAKPWIAIVGQRKATPYGLDAAERMAYELSGCGFIVVSGMAEGIDSAAHRGALKGGSPTVAVFGTAIDKCYPAFNAGLMRQILHNGAILSEYPPGKRGSPGYFPQRNRIISGLCVGTVIAEAKKKSGSLITAGLALDQGRDVFAVPGDINASSCEGTNNLIKQGEAKLVTAAADIAAEYSGLYRLQEIRPRTLSAVYESRQPVPQPQPAADEERDEILAAIGSGAHIDEICERSGLDATSVMSRLTMLELSGRVRQLPGKYFEKI